MVANGEVAAFTARMADKSCFQAPLATSPLLPGRRRSDIALPLSSLWISLKSATAWPSSSSTASILPTSLRATSRMSSPACRKSRANRKITDGFQMRHRGLAERRQVDALQCADQDRRGASGELSVLHHRAERRRSGDARAAARQARGDRQVEGDHPDADELRRHRRPGARRLQGRRPGQPVPRQHPRMRRHRLRAALLRERRHHPCRRPHRSDRATSRRSKPN